MFVHFILTLRSLKDIILQCGMISRTTSERNFFIQQMEKLFKFKMKKKKIIQIKGRKEINQVGNSMARTMRGGASTS